MLGFWIGLFCLSRWVIDPIGIVPSAYIHVLSPWSSGRLKKINHDFFLGFLKIYLFF